jgi:hypothetical protein
LIWPRGEEACIAEAARNEQAADQDLLNLKRKRYAQDAELRKHYARKVYCFMYAYFCMILIIIFLQGFKVGGFDIGGAALATLIGGAFASAVGLVAFVIKGLFPNSMTRQ